MSTTEQLELRALRILHDGRSHAALALRWAKSVVRNDPDLVVLLEAAPAEFTPREISLGATFE